MPSFGRLLVSDARDDERHVRRIARITGLDADDVQARLGDCHGRTLVRTLFDEEWPTTAAQLGALTVASAKRLGLRDEIAEVTGATRILVSRRFNSAHGKKLVRNALWDWWPEGEEEELELEEATEDSDDEDEAWVEAEDADEVEADARLPTRSIEVGTLLSSRYELGRELPAGAFGRAFEAYDRLSAMLVVVKIPTEDDGGALQRELRYAFRLLHPSICQAFPERDDETGRPFLVLQHGGTDLRERLDVSGEPFPVTLAVHVLESIADALDYLHERLIVHLDVSPNNVLIDEEDNVRLTDFGSSANARESMGADGKLTRLATSVFSTTPAYAAPEIPLYGEGRSRSDQYSLAMVFCSLLEGRVFNRRHRFKGFEVLSEVQNAALKRALDPDPEDRFDSCGDFARAVADDLGRVPAEVLSSDLDRVSRELELRLSRETRSRRGAARLGGAVLVGAALERLLQCTLLWMASSDGFDAEQALREIDPRSQGLSRATAGRIAQTIMARVGQPAAGAAEVEAIVRDLTAKKGSRIWRLINFRNEIVHGQREPRDLVPAARELAALLGVHRASAGWAERAVNP